MNKNDLYFEALEDYQYFLMEQLAIVTNLRNSKSEPIWAEYQNYAYAKIPSKPGVYKYRHKKHTDVFYYGQSGKMKSRVADGVRLFKMGGSNIDKQYHAIDKMIDFDSDITMWEVTYTVMDKEIAKRYESFLIDYFDPKFNSNGMRGVA